MISKGRTMLQASVDERAVVLKILITTVPELIHTAFIKCAQELEIEANKCSDEDYEVYISMYQSLSERYRLEDESLMIEEFYRSMVLLICGFAECTLKGELLNPNQRFKGNYLNSVYKQVNAEQKLELKGMGFYWKNHMSFKKTRNQIAHSKCEAYISKAELLEALDGVHTLLRAVADAIAAKHMD